ncbi:hypothetical protein RF11_15326 [Thelohanellus kitauei]|uniref:Uncharacterized protein n=1 Tax=Thelohanellus kitauei TaxID=669202 RepID=A0A0C2LZV2_THEKT|nr:hypothetical protein RF11_15326 [Thelohanellus kitauei]
MVTSGCSNEKSSHPLIVGTKLISPGSSQPFSRGQSCRLIARPDCINPHRHLLTLRKQREETSSDLLSSSYRSFELLKLNPGANVNDFIDELKSLLPKARLYLGLTDLEILVLQRFLGCIPEHISCNIRLFTDLSVAEDISSRNIGG